MKVEKNDLTVEFDKLYKQIKSINQLIDTKIDDCVRQVKSIFSPRKCTREELLDVVANGLLTEYPNTETIANQVKAQEIQAKIKKTKEIKKRLEEINSQIIDVLNFMDNESLTSFNEKINQEENIIDVPIITE